MGILYYTRFGIRVVFGLTTIFVAALYLFQNKLLYMPNPPGFPPNPAANPIGSRSPDEWSIDGTQAQPGSKRIPFETAVLQTSDGELIHVWLLLQKNPSTVATLIYFHGNAGNMGFRLQNAAKMYAAVGINILMMDYRGYGDSTGTPDEVGLNIDADTVLQFVQTHASLQGSPIVVFGRSLGGAVSIALAERYPELVKAVIVENTFLSVAAMVDKLMPAISFAKWLVLRIGWNSDVLIRKLKQPILFISGDSDELVPTAHMRALFDLAEKSLGKHFYSVVGGTHNDTWVRAGATYYKKLRQFLASVDGAVDSKQANAINGAGDITGDCDAAVSSLPTMTTGFGVRKGR